MAYLLSIYVFHIKILYIHRLLSINNLLQNTFLTAISLHSFVVFLFVRSPQRAQLPYSGIVYLQGIVLKYVTRQKNLSAPHSIKIDSII